MRVWALAAVMAVAPLPAMTCEITVQCGMNATCGIPCPAPEDALEAAWRTCADQASAATIKDFSWDGLHIRPDIVDRDYGIFTWAPDFAKNCRKVQARISTRDAERRREGLPSWP